MSSAAVVIGALRVNVYLQYIFFWKNKKIICLGTPISYMES